MIWLRDERQAQGSIAKVFSDPEDAHCCDVAHLPKVGCRVELRLEGYR